MRAASRFVDCLGGLTLALALLLASPGVRVSHAEDFSYDPALDPAASAPAAASAIAGTRVVEQGASCAADQAAPPVPIRSLPLLVGDGDEELNSLNNRGYNIGKNEPSIDLQRILYEARRNEH